VLWQWDRRSLYPPGPTARAGAPAQISGLSVFALGLKTAPNFKPSFAKVLRGRLRALRPSAGVAPTPPQHFEQVLPTRLACRKLRSLVIAKTRTFRAQLLGDLHEFLEGENMACSATQGALVELVVALSRYQEEGVTLYPRFVVCDDLERALRVLQGTEAVPVGQGPREANTIRAALKKCAPLARDGWAGFIHRTKDQFRFGIFRKPSSPTSLDMRDTISSLSEASGQIILVSQLAEKVVELVGASGAQLVVHLSAARDSQPSPLESLERLADVVSIDLPPELQEPVATFLRSTLAGALRRGHGSLIAVVRDEIPNEIAGDAVHLMSPVDIAAAIQAHIDAPTADTLARINAYAQFVEGVLATDGIAVFRTCAQIVAYNWFVRPAASQTALPSEVVGGARRRAHDVLRGLVDSGQLAAAFFRSSDGGSEFYRGEANVR
jgi:hypothetical protein